MSWPARAGTARRLGPRRGRAARLARRGRLLERDVVRGGLVMGVQDTVVVRRQALVGPLEPYDLAREAAVVRALRGGPVPVPAIHLVCEDAAVVGSPFAVMERIEGAVPEYRNLPEYAPWATPEPHRNGARADAHARADPLGAGRRRSHLLELGRGDTGRPTGRRARALDPRQARGTGRTRLRAAGTARRGRLAVEQAPPTTARGLSSTATTRSGTSSGGATRSPPCSTGSWPRRRPARGPGLRLPPGHALAGAGADGDAGAVR